MANEGFPSAPLLYRIPEVAGLLALGRSKVYELIQRGDLPAVHIGSAVRVRATDLHAWVAAQLESY